MRFSVLSFVCFLYFAYYICRRRYFALVFLFISFMYTYWPHNSIHSDISIRFNAKRKTEKNLIFFFRKMQNRLHDTMTQSTCKSLISCFHFVWAFVFFSVSSSFFCFSVFASTLVVVAFMCFFSRRSFACADKQMLIQM